VVAVLAVAGYGGWLLFERHQRDVAAQQALAAAEKFVVMLTTVDSNAIDKHVADVLDGSTGEFNDQYAKSTSGQHRQAIVDSKVTTHGRVVESAVKSATPNRVQVVLMVDQSVSSLATPEPQLDRSRIKMTMQKVDGRWLVSQVELL
jgi:Mce-associated membrane protein